MPSLSETIARMSALGGLSHFGSGQGGAGRLTDLDGFGSNPGALRAKIHLPESLAEHPALVVVLHGCTQTADGYDAGSGWSQLADRHGFALLYPEQQRQNNANTCFNWFTPEDIRRGQGEALSICQMIGAMVETHGIDPARIFVTGLSAGGAMASVMLATYPELFAGGAIIAGLPYACAASVPQAFERMRGHGMPGEAELSGLVRKASPHEGPWPTISIWHGSGDATVSPSNVNAIIGQWRSLHGVQAEPSRVEAVDGYPRRVWCDASGREVMEEYSITGMGHGTPLDTSGADGCGASGAYMLEVSISSTRHICRFWGLAEGKPAAAGQHAPAAEPKKLERIAVSTAATAAPVAGHARGSTARPQTHADAPAGVAGVGKIIEDALRTAGLMH